MAKNEVEDTTPEVEETPADETEVEETEDAPVEESPVEDAEGSEVIVNGDGETTERLIEEAEALPTPEDGDVVENPLTKTEETPDFTKMFSDLSDTITKALDNNREATEAELAKVNEKLEQVEAVANKLDELGAKHTELAEKFNAIDTQIAGVEKRFAEIEKGVGIKKSGDLGGSKDDSTKLEKSASKESLWNGRFFGSVDNI